jgi:hypothetical protein
MPVGGKRPGAGRKPKAKEIKLIQAFDKYVDPEFVIKELAKLMKDTNKRVKFDAIKLYMEYRYGKPKQSMDLTTDGSISINPIEWVGDGKPKYEYKLNGSN